MIAKQPIARGNLAWLVVSIFPLVCLLVTTMHPAKTADMIRMAARMVSGVGPRNHVLHGVKIQHRKWQFLCDMCRPIAKYSDYVAVWCVFGIHRG